MFGSVPKNGCGAEKLYIEKDSIEKGIVELIAKQRIGKLVMGAPAGGKFSSDIELAKAVHASILTFGADNYLLNALITAHLKLGLLSDAYTIFSGMCDLDVVTYTSIISVFGKLGYEFQALELFFRMRESGIEPNEFSFVALLTACGRILELELGFQVHSLARKLGSLSSTFVANALMALCDKCGYLEDALVLFDEMPERDIASWNTFIAGVVNELMYDKAF
ncbi:hypothetical protein Ancab_034844 [Ancistrocladus abbreviatus]